IAINAATDSGGGVFNASTLKLTNVTLAANSAPSGGNIFNQGATLTLNNTIVADNEVGGDIVNVGGTVQGSNNLVEDGSGPAGSLAVDPKLGTLQDNGGPTQTIALLAGSPAIDRGSNALAAASGLTTDQRGLPRVVNGGLGRTVDIGAFESQDPQGAPV